MGINMCVLSHRHAHKTANQPQAHIPPSLRHKVRPLILTHRDPASPQDDQHPWSKTNILTYLFLFYSLRKKARHMAEHRNRW